jgi:hypothetical protein
MFGIKRLRRENAALREALEWYADSANWRKRGTNAPGTTPRTWVKSPAAFDRGARAKFFLSQTAQTDARRYAVWRVATQKVDIPTGARPSEALPIAPSHPEDTE